MTPGVAVLVLVLAALALLTLAMVAHARRRPAPARVVPIRVPRELAAPRPAPTRQAFRDEPHLLYHYENHRGGWVYAGISSNPQARHAKHEAKSRWFGRTTGRMIYDQWYPNYEAAHAAEVVVIEQAVYAGHPMENGSHNPNRRTRDAA